MGQKVHPNGMRLGVIRDWNAKWFANNRDYGKLLDGRSMTTLLTAAFLSLFFR